MNNEEKLKGIQDYLNIYCRDHCNINAGEDIKCNDCIINKYCHYTNEDKSYYELVKLIKPCPKCGKPTGNVVYFYESCAIKCFNCGYKTDNYLDSDIKEVIFAWNKEGEVLSLLR
jgi:hypothetical protein